MQLNEKQQAILDACEHLKTLMRTEKNNEEIENAFLSFLDEYAAYLSKEQSLYEDIYVTFYAMTTILENHIRRGDVLNVGYRMLEVAKMYRDFKEKAPFGEAQKNEISDLVLPVLLQGRTFLYNQAHPHNEIQYARTPEHKCLLCRQKAATKTGSHLIPHFFIQRFFAYDGSTKRDKEMVESYSLANGDNRTFLGHEVSPDVIDDVLGHALSDEEVVRESKKHNLLMRDYFFCPDCEKRFSVIEEYYSNIQKGTLKDYPPHVPYLFWLSVIWRMSIGRLAIHMLPEHEQRVRKVLDQALNTDKTLIKEGSSIGYFAYRLGHAVDLKGETPSIVGIHRASIPYTALIGDYVLCFFPSRHAAYTNAQRSGIDVETINDGRKQEVITELPFIDFWMTKRTVFDDVYQHPSAYDGKSVQDLAQMRNYDDVFHSEWMKDMGASRQMMPLQGMMLEQPGMINIPGAVARIMNAIKECKEAGEKGVSIITEKTGYTKEEIEAMLSYAYTKWGEALGENFFNEE